MEFTYFIFLIAMTLLVFHKKLEKIFLSEKETEYIYAHSLVMETGEILSRKPTDRYPDMEANQKKIKLYYKRSKNAPVNLHNESDEKVKPILISVK